jgi:hypothetical protein
MTQCSTPIAWNGISLSIPAGWQLGRLDNRHLVFQENGTAVMEIKWNRIRGRFSAKSQLKRLTAVRNRRTKVGVTSWSPPAEWAKALEGHQVDGFEWDTQDIGGRGVVLYCPVCRTASLIQFFIRHSQPLPDHFVTILDSFRDHRDDGLMLWSLFDIRAELPEGYLLAEHAFKPGNFTLAFTDRRRSLTLFRWAPAAALLGDQPLDVFASAAIGLTAAQFTPNTIGGYPGVQWHIAKNAQKPWPLGRIGGAPSYRQGRIWHVDDRNRILGVSLADTRPMADDHLSEICASYEIVS